jgi:hypothetical protein
MKHQKGGTQGIPAVIDADKFLPAYAYADFKHDFSGDKITANVLNDIETVGNRSDFFRKIEPLIGKSVFEHFKPDFKWSIPGTVPAKEYTEEALLSEVVGISYEVVSTVGDTVYDPPTSMTIPIAGGAFSRTYYVSRVCEKVKPRPSKYTAQLNTPVPPAGEYANLLSCLWAASGQSGQRKKSFAVMYDAGNCATSEIGMLVNRSITEMVTNPAALFGEPFDKTAIYDVYFINSSENVRDPAPKIVERTFKSVTKAPNVNVYFLNDYGHHSRYEMYSKRGEGSQTGNLYSRYTVTTVRDETGDRIRGTIDYEDGSSRQLDDIKRESEIESATINAVSMYLTETPPLPVVVPDAVKSKIMSCFFLKRTGDWCQALCLLDKERVYKISGYGPRVGNETTLQKLEDENVEIMLMTHDRVLLGYAVTLGLNVCFTNNRPNGHWIIYFKNADIFRVDDAAQLSTTAGTLFAKLKELRNTSEAKREECEAALDNTIWIPVANIVNARRNAYILANLIDSEVFDLQIAALGRIIEEINKTYTGVFAYFAQGNLYTALDEPNKVIAKAYSDMLGKLRNLLPNIQSTVDITTKFTDAGLKYPQQPEEETTLNSDFSESLIAQRSFKASHKNASGKQYNLEASIALIAERFADDVNTAGVTFSKLPSDSEISDKAAAAYQMARITRTQIAIFRSVFDLFNKATAGSRKAQVGGVITDLYWLPHAIYVITQISVPVLAPGSTEDTFGFEIGKHMIHYDRWRYMVADPYIVTKEHRGTLVAAITNVANADVALRGQLLALPYVPYLVYRLLLLYTDLLYNEWLLVSPQGIPRDAEELYDIGEYVTPEEISIQLLSQRVEFMQRAISSIGPGFDVVAFANIIGAYERGDMLGQFANADPYSTILPGITRMYSTLFSNPQAFSFGKTLYELELKASVPADGSSQYVILYNPPDGTSLLYEYGPTAVFRGPQFIVPEGVGGARFFQNVATNVYVPLIPQPNPDQLQATIVAWKNASPVYTQAEMNTNLGGGSHLGGRRPLYSKNVRSALVGSSRSKQHARLRERAWPRHTYRVRQSTRKSQTRRQRKHLDSI